MSDKLNPLTQWLWRPDCGVEGIAFRIRNQLPVLLSEQTNTDRQHIESVSRYFRCINNFILIIFKNCVFCADKLHIL